MKLTTKPAKRGPNAFHIYNDDNPVYSFYLDFSKIDHLYEMNVIDYNDFHSDIEILLNKLIEAKIIQSVSDVRILNDVNKLLEMMNDKNVKVKNLLQTVYLLENGKLESFHEYKQ